MRANQGSEAMAGAYGRSLGAKYGAEDAPAIVTRSLHSTEIAVTEICVHRPPGRLSDPIPRVNAYMVSLMLSDLPTNAQWGGGRQGLALPPRGNQGPIPGPWARPPRGVGQSVPPPLFYIPFAA